MKIAQADADLEPDAGTASLRVDMILQGAAGKRDEMLVSEIGKMDRAPAGKGMIAAHDDDQPVDRERSRRQTGHIRRR